MFDAASLQLSQSKLILPITVSRDSGQFAEEEPAPDISRHPRHVLQSRAAELQVGLLTGGPEAASPGQTEPEGQPGDQQRSGQPSPGGHCHQLHLRGQRNISINYRNDKIHPAGRHEAGAVTSVRSDPSGPHLGLQHGGGRSGQGGPAETGISHHPPEVGEGTQRSGGTERTHTEVVREAGRGMSLSQS